MPPLAPAPLNFPPGSFAQLDRSTEAFFGRSLAEYAHTFMLDLVALKGRDVLDVAAGPSSFTAEACARRIDAVAVDPRYGDPVATLAPCVAQDLARMMAQMRAKPRSFRGGAFPSVAALAIDRQAAAQRFLQDYETHFAYGRYVSGALPRLPFFDGTFDLVLCGHLLFIDAMRFDFDWHLGACRELVRVSAAEVRIHPLGAPEGRPYPGLARLRRELRAGGVASQVVGGDGGAGTGAAAMLVLRRASP